MTTTQESTGITETGLFIDNVWTDSAGGTFTDLNPATGQPLAEVTASSAADVDTAVRSARASLEDVWGATPDRLARWC